MLISDHSAVGVLSKYQVLHSVQNFKYDGTLATFAFVDSLTMHQTIKSVGTVRQKI